MGVVSTDAGTSAVLVLSTETLLEDVLDLVVLLNSVVNGFDTLFELELDFLLDFSEEEDRADFSEERLGFSLSFFDCLLVLLIFNGCVLNFV